MIILVTGQPGSGKTAYVVDWLLDQQKDRPLFCMGIPELKVDHQPVPPVNEWTEERESPEDPAIKLSYFKFPPSSIVIIDEAQRVFRPRPVGSPVPPWIAAFETHRHTGVDFVLISQAPNLMDSNLRRLIGKHVHIRVLPMGRRLYEWTEVGEPESKMSRDLAASRSYKLPKRVFDVYKSAELHTKIKVAIPWYYWLFGGALLLTIFFGWRSYKAISKNFAPQENGTTTPASLSDPAHPKPAPVLDPVAAQKPRISGLLHTAPAYDTVTTAKEAPVPVACYLKNPDQPDQNQPNEGKSCGCLDQQSNIYKTTFEICKQIASSGFFNSWETDSQQGGAK